MNNKEYHAAPGISKSGLDLINQSPDAYKYSLENERIITPTLQATFDIGSLVHSLVLEPNKTDSEFIRGLDVNKNTKVYKEFKAANSDKTVIGIKEYEHCVEMATAVKKHNNLFTDGKAEVSIFAEEDGLTLKCRPDWLRDDGWIIDLKTVSSLADFEKGILNHRYYVQHYFYTKVCELAGYDIKGFKFVAVSKSKPTQVAIYELTEDYINEGRIAAEKDLATLKTCMEFDHYSYKGKSESIIVDKPKWMNK